MSERGMNHPDGALLIYYDSTHKAAVRGNVDDDRPWSAGKCGKCKEYIAYTPNDKLPAGVKPHCIRCSHQFCDGVSDSSCDGCGPVEKWTAYVVGQKESG